MFDERRRSETHALQGMTSTSRAWNQVRIRPHASPSRFWFSLRKPWNTSRFPKI